MGTLVGRCCFLVLRCPRERQFELLKAWAARYTAELWALLGHRSVFYGKWCYGKHSIFYSDLPHYLLEFDLYDIEDNVFLSTERRGNCSASFQKANSQPHGNRNQL